MDSRDWSLNGNTISLDEDTVIDVPEPFNLTENYCASIGHKANHSFTPNCKYDLWVLMFILVLYRDVVILFPILNSVAFS